jgi:membrane-bound lytic murein transglycosylase D
MGTTLPASTDTVHVTRQLHFQQIADLCNVSLGEIESLNPQYRKQIIPGNTQVCTLRLPQSAISAFVDKQDTIYAHRADELFKNRKTVAVKETATRKASTTAVAGNGKPTYYKIKSGDTLSGIAEKLGVSQSNLRKWNGISGSRITAGKQLKIYK